MRWRLNIRQLPNANNRELQLCNSRRVQNNRHCLVNETHVLLTGSWQRNLKLRR